VVEYFEGFNAYVILVDEASRYVWAFLHQSKIPPVDLIMVFLSIYGNTSSGVLRTDLGSKLARSTTLQTTVLKETKYIIEPTGADCPSQNTGAEQWNQTLAITTQSLLYGSGLPARYWYAALLHAAYTHNCHVHSITKITLFEAWFRERPDLCHL
jgi:hypothetical protein